MYLVLERILCYPSNSSYLTAMKVPYQAMFRGSISVLGINAKKRLYKILYAYPQITFINKGLSVVQKLHVRCY